MQRLRLALLNFHTQVGKVLALVDQPVNGESSDLLRALATWGDAHLVGGAWRLADCAIEPFVYAPALSCPNDCVEYLLEKGLAPQKDGGTTLAVSERGLDYLRKYDQSGRETLRRAMNLTIYETMQELATQCRRQGHDVLWTAYMVAGLILGKAVGIDWLEKHVMGTTAPTDFFKNDCSTDERQRVHHHRVISLAEMLMNLRAAPGFPQVLKKLKTDSPEATFAELEAGKLLFLNGVPFRFRSTTGVKGDDYDLEILYEGQEVCADTKCRLETTEKKIKSTVSVLNHARSQLPANRPSIIPVKTPQVWAIDFNEHEGFMRQCADEFFRGTGRVVAIVFFQNHIFQSEGNSTELMVSNVYQNPNQKYCKEIDWNSLNETDGPITNSWAGLVNACL